MKRLKDRFADWVLRVIERPVLSLECQHPRLNLQTIMGNRIRYRCMNCNALFSIHLMSWGGIRVKSGERDAV